MAYVRLISAHCRATANMCIFYSSSIPHSILFSGCITATLIVFLPFGRRFTPTVGSSRRRQRWRQPPSNREIY